MPVRLLSERDRRDRSLALRANHEAWVARQLAAGADGSTPSDRKDPSDYNQHVPVMEADSVALDEYFGGMP